MKLHAYLIGLRLQKYRRYLVICGLLALVGLNLVLGVVWLSRSHPGTPQAAVPPSPSATATSPTTSTPPPAATPTPQATSQATVLPTEPQPSPPPEIEAGDLAFCGEEERMQADRVWAESVMVGDHALRFYPEDDGQNAYFGGPALALGQTRTRYLDGIGTLDSVRVLYVSPSGQLRSAWVVFWLTRPDNTYLDYVRYLFPDRGGQVIPQNRQEAQELLSTPWTVYLSSLAGRHIQPEGIRWEACTGSFDISEEECRLAQQIGGDAVQNLIEDQEVPFEADLYGWRLRLADDVGDAARPLQNCR